MVYCWFKSIKSFTDFIVDVFIAWSKLITKQMKNSKINFICTVSIGGMHIRLNVRRIVEQNIEHKVALMFVSPDNPSINRNVVSNQGVGYNALFQSKIFRRMTGINRINPSFKLLSITTGMDCPINIIMMKY